jgi:hypothetical protein
LDLTPQFCPVRDTENCGCSQPVRYISPMDTANELTNPPVFLSKNILADVTEGIVG